MARREGTKRTGEEPAVLMGGVPGLPPKDSRLASPQQMGRNTKEPRETVDLIRRATEVLGIHHVGRWMRTRIPSLGNQTPYALMQSEDGRKQVDRVLLKIEHGVY